MDTNEMFMTFKLLKRRYRSSEESEKLRKLDYFNHPYNKENEIQLIDDVELEKSVSLTSLSTQFMGAEEVGKRGKKNAVERDKKKDKNTLYEMEYEPFDFNKSMN